MAVSTKGRGQSETKSKFLKGAGAQVLDLGSAGSKRQRKIFLKKGCKGSFEKILTPPKKKCSGYIISS